MKLEDAPPPGWYPDPERTAALRWWEGTDWTDHRRQAATVTEVRAAARAHVEPATPPVPRSGASRDFAPNTPTAEQILAQVRTAAREEVERAADLFSQRTRTAIRSSQSLVTDYLSGVLRLIRIAVVVAALLVIAWFIFQLIAQATFFEWLGDRIDNVTAD